MTSQHNPDLVDHFENPRAFAGDELPAAGDFSSESHGAHESAKLDLDADEMEHANSQLATFLNDYSSAAANAYPVAPAVDSEALTELLNMDFPEDGLGVEQFFQDVRTKVVPQSVRIAHPRFLAYVVGTLNGIAPYADAIATALNQNCGFQQLGTAGSAIEGAVVRWLGSMFDFGPTMGGLLTGGGSIATLNALTAALHQARPDFRRHGLQDGTNQSPLTLYTSVEAHKSVDKAAAILGLGIDNVRHVPVDHRHRMDLDVLRTMVAADRQAGATPFCVVAAAGTVTGGAIDPIRELLQFCREQGLWLHVDGAYGALFILADQPHPDLLACGQADSLTLDPHKMLFAGIEAGCLLVRDRRTLERAFAFRSTYLPGAVSDELDDYMHLGPQLTRRFNALRIWGSLRTFGVSAFREAAQRCLDLAAYLADEITLSDDLQLAAPVTLSAVCVRVNGASAGDYDSLLHTLNRDALALLGPAIVDGEPCIRACVTNFRTTESDIDAVVAHLRNSAARLRTTGLV